MSAEIVRKNVAPYMVPFKSKMHFYVWGGSNIASRIQFLAFLNLNISAVKINRLVKFFCVLSMCQRLSENTICISVNSFCAQMCFSLFSLQHT